MPNFKQKPGGFKMKGFSYPGQSPLKTSKKKAAAEAEAIKVRMEDYKMGLEELTSKSDQNESYNLLTDAGPGTNYGAISGPGTSPVTLNKKYTGSGREHDELGMSGEDKKFVETISDNTTDGNGDGNGSGDGDGNGGGDGGTKEPGFWKKAGNTAMTAGIEAGISAGINAGIQALIKKDDKTPERRNTQENFSRMKIGGSSSKLF
jgi:hypothetical protein